MPEIRLDAASRAYFDHLIQDLGPGKLGTQIKRFFQSQGRAAADEAITIFRDRLNVRSGVLRQSIMGRGEMFQGLPALRLGTLRAPSLKYARVQEYGTQGENPASDIPTIRPKRAKNLAVPLAPRALTPSGVPRYASPRGYPWDLHFIPFRRGVASGALYDERDMKKYQRARSKGKRMTLRDLQPAYLLLKQVDVKPHYFLRDGMEAFLPKLARKLGEFLKALFIGRTTDSGGPPTGAVGS